MPSNPIRSKNYIEKLNGNKLLQRLLDSFSTITRMNVAVTDIHGHYLLTSQKKDTDFCRLIKASTSGRERCWGSYARAGKEAKKWNEPYFFKCHAGLIAWACPILLHGKLEGNFICGQVLMWEPDEYHILEIMEMTRKLDLGQDALLEAVKKLDVISADQMQAAADLLYIAASYFALSGISTLDYQHKLRMISSWLWNENNKQNNQRQDQGKAAIIEQDIFQLENEIFKEIRLSNKETARDLLNRLALKFFIRSKGQIEIIKGLSIEFISLLTRFATECGTRFEESIHYSFNRLQELKDADTVEKVILWLLATGDCFINLLTNNNNTDPNEMVIHQALSYIEENYSSEDLSLQEIAINCHISPSYLSRIFKRKRGYNITEQVNMVRIEKAKRLLQESDLAIVEAAKRVGFSDRSYFCKVFKKLVGLSPSDYKKRFKEWNAGYR